MAEQKFDPYHTWLGIPPRDQPPHAYRLLGLESFEEKREVIEAAANRQMAYLQEISSGNEHIDQAQKLLGEVSRARVCLLTPEKKQAYDARLKAKLAAESQLELAPLGDLSSDKLSGGESLGQGATTLGGPGFRSASASPESPERAKPRKQLNHLAIIRTVLVVLLGAVAVLIALAVRDKSLTARVYEDRNNNGRFDAGEGIDGKFVDIYRKEPEEDASRDEVSGFQTALDGYVKFSLPPGKHKIGVDLLAGDPYELAGDAYQEVDMEGMRLTGPELEFRLRKTPRVILQGSAYEERDGRQIPAENVRILADLNRNGQPDHWEEAAKTDKRGRFTFPELLAKGDKQVQLLMMDHRLFETAEPLPVDLSEDGQIVKIPLRRKSANVAGTVFEDRDQNGKVDDGDERLSGYVVYVDLNNNEELDENDPHDTTDQQGSYRVEVFLDGIKHALRLKLPEETPYEYRGRSIQLQSSDPLEDAHFAVRKKKSVEPAVTERKDAPATEGESIAQTDPVQATEQQQNTTETPQPATTDNGGVSDEVVIDPEQDPAKYLRSLGFAPRSDEGQSQAEEGEGAIWIFEVDAESAKSFMADKAKYEKARKKANWDRQLGELQRRIKELEDQSKRFRDDASSNRKTASQQDEARERAKIAETHLDEKEKEYNDLADEKNQLLAPVRTAASYLTEEQRQYDAAIENKDAVKKAAEKIAATIQPAPKPQQRVWDSASQFDAEMQLTDLGLVKIKRRWMPPAVAELPFKNSLYQSAINQILRSGYLQKKKQQTSMIQKADPKLEPQIESLGREISTMERNTIFKKQQARFGIAAQDLIATIEEVQAQLAKLQENQQQIEAALEKTGGRYSRLVKQFPSPEDLQKLREQVSDTLQQVGG